MKKVDTVLMENRIVNLPQMRRESQKSDEHAARQIASDHGYSRVPAIRESCGQRKMPGLGLSDKPQPDSICGRIQSCDMTSYAELFFPTISYPITRAHRVSSANFRAMIP